MAGNRGHDDMAPSRNVSVSMASAQAPIPDTTAEVVTVSHNKPLCRRISERQRKIAIGALLAAGGALCFVGMTSFIRYTCRRPSYKSPFFTVYFITAWMLPHFPIYVAGRWIFSKEKRQPIKTLFRANILVYDHDDASQTTPKVRSVLCKILLFSLAWSIASYLFVRALAHKNRLDVSAFFASNSTFVYMMSWIVLRYKFKAIKIVAFVVTMVGVVAIFYTRSDFTDDDMWGSILAVSAVGTAATYKVLFEKFIGKPTIGQISLFLSCLGLFNSLSMVPMLLLLLFTHTEPIDWTSVPWRQLSAAAAFAIAFNVLLTYGGTWTYAMFLQASFVLAMPLCVGTDLLLSEPLDVPPFKIAAYALIVVGFVMNFLPDDWYTTLLTAARFKPAPETAEHTARMTPRERLRSLR